MIEKETKVYIIHAMLLNEPNQFAQAWDTNRQLNPFNWPLVKSHAFQHKSYQAAWNRLQQLYSENRKKLNVCTFSLIELTVIRLEDVPISSEARLEELHRHFSAKEFESK